MTETIFLNCAWFNDEILMNLLRALHKKFLQILSLLELQTAEKRFNAKS